MTDKAAPAELDLQPEHNIAEFSVGEISHAVKRALEGTFERVRVRGEVSRPNYHGSGHLYFALKDKEANIDGVCWRGNVTRLDLTLEEGMEVVCTGRISSYPRSSKYQIVVEAVELAGEGALLKLLEDRRKKLDAEGLFDLERKQDLPYLPEIIGVITSPTGAVIRDILHRLNDRFPRHVILWPCPVQGQGAAEKIASAIRGFNGFAAGGSVPRPELLIVARGGGSLEDLWPFNEEEVVRAAAASNIPLISAVGHETDTTLIDFAADVRAPTPTAAAEMAVPVRTDLMAQIFDSSRRLISGMERCWEDQRLRIESLGRGLPQPDYLLEEARQRLDGETERLGLAFQYRLSSFSERVEGLSGRLRHPRDIMQRASVQIVQIGGRLQPAMERVFESLSDELNAQAKLLDSVSYKRVLDRGFALVRDGEGTPILRAASATPPGSPIEVEFIDGAIVATIHSDSKTTKSKQKHQSPKNKSVRDDGQGSLL